MNLIYLTSQLGDTYLLKVDNDIVVDAIPFLQGASAIPNIIALEKYQKTPYIQLNRCSMSKLQEKMREKIIGLSLEKAKEKLPSERTWEMDHCFTEEDFQRAAEYNENH